LLDGYHSKSAGAGNANLIGPVAEEGRGLGVILLNLALTLFDRESGSIEFLRPESIVAILEYHDRVDENVICSYSNLKKLLPEEYCTRKITCFHISEVNSLNPS